MSLCHYGVGHDKYTQWWRWTHQNWRKLIFFGFWGKRDISCDCESRWVQWIRHWKWLSLYCNPNLQSVHKNVWLRKKLQIFRNVIFRVISSHYIPQILPNTLIHNCCLPPQRSRSACFVSCNCLPASAEVRRLKEFFHFKRTHLTEQFFYGKFYIFLPTEAYLAWLNPIYSW